MPTPREGGTTMGNYACGFAMLITLAACSGKSRPFATDPAPAVGGSGAAPVVDPGSPEVTNSEAGAGAEPAPIAGEATANPIALVPPAGGVKVSGNGGCDADAGTCAPDAGSSACTPTGPRDCTSALDNDCDGQPDNTLDAVCRCAIASAEPCDEHPGLDGRGPCQPGSRTCIAGDAGLSSDWGVCEGAVGPGARDSCSVVGDDTDCDGTNNGGCPCIDGEVRACGPDPVNGLCQLGSQTCATGAFGPCEGAVFPSPRDCNSDQDNDCDGQPDNTLDNVCSCTVGSTQACGLHPGQDGNGPCRAGSQTCVAGPNGTTSLFDVCVGSVGPGAADSCVDGDDADCDGIPNEGCACIDGQTRACGADTDLGICQRGSQTCVNGSFETCEGAVGPAPRNCASADDNDCDGQPDNTLDSVCQCIPGQGNGPCSGDPDNARCDGSGRCAPCQDDADCSEVPEGKNSCVTGRCVQSLLGAGETCVDHPDCESGVCLGWYLDRDQDGFGSDALRACSGPDGAPVPPSAEHVLEPGDCCDLGGLDRAPAAQINPGQADLFLLAQSVCPTVADFDYNCSDDIEYDYQEDTEAAAGGCAFEGCEGASVWALSQMDGQVPECGTLGLLVGCVGTSPNCTSRPGGEVANRCH